MVAVMEKLHPEGLGHDLLLEWAPWMREDRDGKASWSVKQRLDPSYHGDPPDRVMLVDKIVARHRLENPSYWRVTAAYYLGEKAPWQIAKDMRWPESRVLTNLLSFCGLVEREYRDLTGTNQ